MSDLAKLDYVDRVNRAIDHIVRNLSGPLKLEDVARVAHFSPFHFHRIFSSIVGETLNAFTRRVRLERAIYLLSHRQGASMTEVALACGFSSSSDFSRNFRQKYGVPPSEFDLAGFRASHRDQLLTPSDSPGDSHRVSALPVVENPDEFQATLRDLPARRLVYLRVLQPYEGDGVVRTVERLVQWAQVRGLAEGQWFGYQWDDPEIVPLDRCRYDVGLEIPESAVVDGGVSETEFDSMKVAELEIRGSIELEIRALDWLFGVWLPSSGFAPAHHPVFEAWNGLPFAHGNEHFELRLHLPVVDKASPLWN